MLPSVKAKLKTINSTNMQWLWPYISPFLKPLSGLLILGITASLVNVGAALMMKRLLDTAVSAGAFGDIVWPAAEFAILLLVGILLTVLNTTASAAVLERFSIHIRQGLFHRLSHSDWLALSQYHSEDLVTRMTSDTQAIGDGVVSVFSTLITLLSQFLFSFGVLCYFDWRLALAVVCIAPVCVLAIKLAGQRFKHFYINIQETESRFRAFIQESLANITVVKAFEAEGRNMETLQSLHRERMAWILKKNKLSALSSGVMMAAYTTGYIFTFLWGMRGIILKTVSYGSFMAYLQLVSRVQTPVIRLANSIPQLIGMFASIERLRALEALPIEEDIREYDHGYAPDCSSDSPVSMLVEDVTFSYAGSGENSVLRHISLHVEPGEIVSVTGLSGAGKTTLIRLLLALVRPSQGQVLFSSRAGGHYPASKATRRLLSYIPQGNTLISGSIADNLRLGNPHATKAEMLAALETACCLNVVESLTEGIDTIIGESGAGLSEGQAQRIAIARALLRGRPFLIMDEATSALDQQTEAQLFANITALPRRPACLVITHREFALGLSDRVYHLSDGTLHCLIQKGQTCP